ncbi:MAG: hypothetical protein HOV68_20640 [Streptomycetaceae bacterium]|nr:hypothetical protein [Streptomycetaceae bacterium]
MGATGDRSAQDAGSRHGPRWRRNPLRCRAQTWQEIFVAMVVVVLCAVPAMAFLAARAQYNVSEAERRAQLASAHTVRATSEQNAYGDSSGLWTGDDGPVTATVSWVAADGTPRVGEAPVDPPVRIGETTAIWLDDQGEPVEQPGTSANSMLDAVSLGIVVLLGGAGLLLIVYSVERSLFTRSRLNAWAREWAEVAPRWTTNA